MERVFSSPAFAMIAGLIRNSQSSRFVIPNEVRDLLLKKPEVMMD